MFEGLKVRRATNRIMLKQLEMIEARSSADRTKQALEDSDESSWIMLAGENKRALSEIDSETLQANAIRFYYTNPHGRNVIRLIEKYVVGRGFQVRPQSTAPEVKEWWDLFWKTNKMRSRAKEIVRRCMRDGEVFLRRFVSKKEPGMMLLRFMDPALVRNPQGTQVGSNTTYGIETDPEDVETPVKYWYDGKPIPAAEVFHFKILVDSDVKRGRTFLEIVARWLALYRDWLEDRIKLNKVRSTVALVRKVLGTPTQAANIAAAYKTKRLLNADSSQMAQMPEGVSVVTTNKNVEYAFLSPNLQASDVHHDGRAILLAIAAGTGFPEFMVTSDASNANYASTMVAEAPGTREFQDWQDYFADVFETIFTACVEMGRDAGKLPASEEQEQEPEEPGKEPTVATVPLETGCDIVFPELVHRDILQETQAYVLQVGQAWMSKRTAATRLDLDYDSEREQIRREAEEEDADATPEDKEYERQRDKLLNPKDDEDEDLEEPEGGEEDDDALPK
jgi:hypothetical protein